MSWWKRLFGSEPSSSNESLSRLEPAAPGEIANVYVEDELFREARNFMALTGAKSPSELARSLKISHARASALIEAVSSTQVSPQETYRATVHAGSADIKLQAPAQARSPLPNQKAKARTKSASANLPPVAGKITGTQECGFNIVGESYHQSALRRLRNGRHMATDNDFVADIVTEPDNPHDENACAVYIEGSKVGYLPRAAAMDFVRQMGGMNVTGAFRLQAKAKLSGGWGDRPMIGVLLNLPKT